MYKKIEKICRICTEVIIGRNNLYCNQCNIDRKKKPIKNIHCENCNEIFQNRSYSRKYCSDYCRKIMTREKQKLRLRKKGKGYAEGKIKGNCKVCNKEFSLRTPIHIFCSIVCRKKYYDDINNHTIFEANGLHRSLRLRFEILKRDNFICQYCGRNPKEDKCKLEVDHIIPRSKGGKDIPSNLITSCFECNQGKKDVILENRKLPKLNIIKVEVQNEI